MMQYSVLAQQLPRPAARPAWRYPDAHYGSHYLTDNSWFLVVCLVALVLVWVIDDNVVRSRMGRAFRMIREDEAVAQSFGIPVVRYKLVAFILSGAMAGFAGALYGQAIGFVNNETFGLLPSLLLITMVVVGGQGHRLAVVLAAVLFILFPTWLPMMKGWEVVIGGVVLMLTVAQPPGGHRRPGRANGRAKPRAGVVEDVRSLPQLPTPPTRIVDQIVAPGAPLLEVKGSRWSSAGEGGRWRAFVVPQGRIVGLIGPNGAGKSTLVQRVTGTVPSPAAPCTTPANPIGRLSTDKRAQSRHRAQLPEPRPGEGLSVHQNLMFAQHQIAGYGDVAALLRLRGVARIEADLSEAADRPWRHSTSPGSANEPVKNLSGGQQRIVEIASLLLTAPELIMLDEPTAGLAPGVTENLADRLRQLRDEFGRTVLIIEHNIPFVLDTCDEVYVLDAGRVIAHGDPREIVSDPRVVEAYFGSRGRRLMDAQVTALQATGIVTGFGRKQVLHGIDLTVHEGTISGIFGLNGAGKSVLMKTIAGAVPTWAGNIEFFGDDITRLPAEERVPRGLANVPQGRQVFPSLTVENNLRVGGITLRRRDKARYAELLDHVYETFPILKQRRRQLAGTFSGGQQAMLAVARALVCDPQMLLIDEPTAGLAPAVIDELLDALLAIRETGLTILLVEQNIRFGLQLVDTAILLQQGRVAYSGDTGTLDATRLAEYLGVGRLLADDLSSGLAAPSEE